MSPLDFTTGRERPLSSPSHSSASLALLLRRGAIAVLAMLLTISGLVVLTAWIALRVAWAIPDPAGLSGPTELLARDGTVIARFTAEVDRRVVDLDQVSPALIDAVVASEDARFYEHEGVDPLSLLRAVVSNIRTGGIVQGGSTLTQQYVKNAFVGHQQTLSRKVQEAVIAIQLERERSKEEILEAYLNTVYFGEGAYGVEAAARTYFGVSAAELDVAQSATLAQLLPAPSVRNPRVDPNGSRDRRDALLNRMVELGRLTPAEAREAQATPVEVAPRQRLQTAAPAFVDYVRRQLEHAFGPQAVLTGAMTVQTTLDLDAQRHLDAVLAERLPPEEAGPVEAAAVAIDPRTGDILAIHGGRDLRVGDFNLATMARRQNGSAFKPFVAAAAIEDEVTTIDQRWPAPGSITISDCKDHDGGPISVSGGPGGTVTVHEALVRSVNTTFQRLGCEVGGPRVVEMAERMGVRHEIPPVAAVALGGSTFGASVLDMASAYGTLANDGVSCPARSIVSITGPDGQTVAPPAEVVIAPDLPRRPRALSDEERSARPAGLEEMDANGCVGALERRTAREITQALSDAVTRGTGQRASIGRPQAGKTGTTQEERDAWFVGYTPHLSLAVWVGDPGREGPVRSLRDLAGFARVQGGTVPAVLWAAIAEPLLAEVPPDPFGDPDDAAVDPEDPQPRVAPGRPVESPTPEPTPMPTGSPSPEAEPSPQPTDPGDEPPDEDDDDDEEGCFIIFGRC